MKRLVAIAMLWPALPLPAAPRSAPSTAPAAIHASYQQAVADLARHFWNAAARPPHAWPTRGGNSSGQHDVGLIDEKASKPSFWQMAQYANIQYWNWKIAPTAASKTQIQSQWNYVQTAFPGNTIASCSKNAGIVNVSDDAAWAINYLAQVHEATGDPRALSDAATLLSNTLDRFADPDAPRVRYGNLQSSPYGILYATPSDHGDHQGCSSSYEIMIANAALYIYQHNHNKDFLDYAVGTYGWTHQYMKHPKRGYYYCELDIRPLVDGVKNPHFLVPNGDFFGPPVRGLSSSYSGGTLAMAVCAARLYRISDDAKYLQEAQQITADYVKKQSFLRPGDRFVNDRDAWTDGYWAPCFANEVLSLPDVDPAGTWKAAIADTALSIVSQRTAEGFYTADWSGPELNTNDKTMSWTEQGNRGIGMALPQQIMTSSGSVAMVIAAEIAASPLHNKTP